MASLLPITVVAALVAVSPAEAAVPAAVPTAKPGCPAELPDENAALTTARICGGPVVIAGLTTETDQASATPDGTVRWEHHYRPVRVATTTGGWLPVDTTLRKRADGTVAPVTAAVDMVFSGGGTAPMVKIAEKGATFALKAPFGALPKPTLNGDTATYPEVLPGVDLRLSADVDGYAEILVVKNRKAARHPSLSRIAFPIAADGMATSTDKGGNLRVTDRRGRLVLTGNTPLMWDGAAEPNRGGHTKTIPTKVSGRLLTVTPNSSLLDSPDTTFPVYIDPGVTLNRSSWAMVDSSAPATTYWNSSTGAQVGISGTSVKRSFFNLDLAATPVAGKYVTSAALNLDLTGSASCTARQVDLYATGTATATTTWNTQPSWTELQSSQTVAKGFNSSCPAGPIAMDATSGLRTAVAAGASSFTLGLRATNETDSTFAKTFGNSPALTVSYTAYPTAIELMTSPSTPCRTGIDRPYINTVTPLLQARLTDPEVALVRPEFSWSAVSGTAIGTAQPTPGQTSGLMQATTVPSGAFANGGSYLWKVRGFDGIAWGPWSTVCEFTVDTVAPTSAPTVSSTTYPAGTWAGATGTSGTFTLGAAGVTDIAAYIYGLDAEPTTVVNTASLSAAAEVTITPAADGPHTLKVQSRDRGGNLSPVATYTFNVGTGAVAAPTTGTQTAGKVALSGISKTTSSGITYQWRRGDTDTWATIPAADVATATGGGTVTWPATTTGSGAYPDLVWNVAQTVNAAEAGATALDGPVQVRASLSGTTSGVSTGVVFTLDQNETEAATAEVGPGTVNLVTGNYLVGATDVDTIGGLGVQRTFNTRQATAIDAMFGPGWTAGIEALAAETYTELTITGNLAQVGLADGGILGFTRSSTTSTGAVFTAEVGNGDTRLAYLSGNDTYTLTEGSGDTVTFSRRTGDPAGLYTPTSSQTAGSTGASTISWQKTTLTTGDVVQPTRVLAPVPAGVTCTTLVKGCRALTFSYATSTTATTSALGNYTGRLTQVALTAWDPDLATPAMRTVALRQYTYDTTGLLRSVWDPRLDYTSSSVTQHVATSYTYNTDGTLATVTPPGEQAWSFTYTTLPTDPGAGRLYKVSRSALAAGTSVQTVVYNVPISGNTAPVDMAGTIARWGQNAVPVDATSVYPGDIVPDGNPATGALPSYSTDDRVTVHYMDVNGRTTNVMRPGGAVDATFHDAYGNILRHTTAANITRALYNSNTDTPAQEAAITRSVSTVNVYSADGQRLLESQAPEQDTVLTDWSTVRGRTHTVYTYDENAPSDGFNLETTRVESLQYVVSGATVDTDKRTTTTTYDWTLRQPATMAVDPAGLALTNRWTYDSVTAQVASSTIPAGNAAGTTPSTRKSVYYRAATGSGDSACDNHAEWATLPCLTAPGAQPGSGSEIPSTLTTYDLYGQLRSVVDRNSSGTLRTVTTAYDGAGRFRDVTVASGLGTPVSKERSVYAPATGYLTGTQSLDGSGNVIAAISRSYDTLGRITSYTDADGAVSTTSYDLLSRRSGTNDAKGTQSIGYNGNGEKRGLPTGLVDSQAGTFSAAYDVNGMLATETRPDGITVRHHYNENQQSTGLEYVTDPACDAAGCTLYYDYSGYDTHSKVRWDASSFSDSGYGYDDAGRLTGVRQDTSTGCSLRKYAFDSNSNRIESTAYAPATNGDCQDGSPATSSTSTYDTADRAANTGYTHDVLGRTTTIPAIDTVNGTADLTTTYYTNNLPRSVTQGTTTATYELDVLSERHRSYTSGGVTRVNHYGSDSDNTSWIAEGSGYTRPVTSFQDIAAIYTASPARLDWQIANLHGDIVAIRTGNSVGLTATYVTDEYGKPATGTVPRYGYLGNKQRSGDNPAGLLSMGVRLYNPATGRFSSTDQVYGGSANAYDYGNVDPVNNIDPTGYAAAAAANVIVCRATIGNPHSSHHNPGGINVVSKITCSQAVSRLQIRVKLYVNGLFANSSLWTAKHGSSWIQKNAYWKCRVGTTYRAQGFTQYNISFPPRYVPSYREGALWSNTMKVLCENK